MLTIPPEEPDRKNWRRDRVGDQELWTYVGYDPQPIAAILREPLEGRTTLIERFEVRRGLHPPEAFQ